MIQKLSNIADQLREREQILPEVQLVSKALATLPENFRIVRTVWTSLPANDRTLDHLLQRLITEESVLKSYQTKTENNNEAAFTSRQRFNSGRGGSGRERHGVQGGFVDKRPRCGHCNSPTHEEKVCFQKHGYPPNWNTTKRGRGRGRGGGNPSNSSNALLSLSNLDPRSILTFLVDSGASKHMSDQRSFFTTFKPIKAGTWSVKGIGDSELDALGVGNIDVIVEVDQTTTSKTLTEVLYVPGLGSNLFSVSAATANGLIVTFDDNKVLFKRNGETVLTGEKQNETLFQLHMKPDIHSTQSDNIQPLTLVALVQ
ncbi:uncharacterized protein LOC124200559 [Daphnia pulex]|uniref:uncharacterized protein LOC124200559 n=1 Tax=Daphnia pulex TaxID=6669 RepID=UPI001EDE22A7|nr:uncharacterized protein LOC124200559 [Daphnia pulex]